MIERYPSQWLEKAIDQFSMLPGIGRKTALRLALHLLRQPEGLSVSLGQSIIDLRKNTTYCSRCYNISDSHLCNICANPLRDVSVICVVESIKEVMAIEQTGKYRGLYHVLGGIISPIEGIGPADLNIDALIERTKTEPIKEVIMALRSTMEGDTTNYYIYRKLDNPQIIVSQISRGISVGDEIEYADEVTLGNAITHRIPFEG
ncbi:MAG: recombination mediator RecR [Porphyromonas sp.]|nr:recombination mediator RecR [Porphyromonas sp.]